MTKPALPPNDRRSERIQVLLRPEEVANLDAVKGTKSRSGFISDVLVAAIKRRLKSARSGEKALEEPV